MSGCIGKGGRRGKGGSVERGGDGNDKKNNTFLRKCDQKIELLTTNFEKVPVSKRQKGSIMRFRSLPLF